MWVYLAAFAGSLAVDTIPVFAPPAWIVLVYLQVAYHPNPWLIVVAGVAGSTIGRYIFSLYIPKLSRKLLSAREDKNLKFVGSKMEGAPLPTAAFVFGYTLTPLSTTTLFTAIGIARVSPWVILPPFFIGRLCTDGFMVHTGKFASENFSTLTDPAHIFKTIGTLVFGCVIICLFLFIDWRRLIQKHQLKWNFKILK